MNQRRNWQSKATYAQCGRQHFHPTFAVAMSAGSMIPAWPREQRHHPRRKGRVTKVHPERAHHPSGRLGGKAHLLSLSRGPPGASSVGMTAQVWGQSPCVPTNAHEAQSVHFPSPGTWSQEASVGLPRLPLLGRRKQSGGPALPSLPAGTHRSGRGAHVGRGYWQVLSQHWGNRKSEGSGWLGQV